jgi:VanZ family protein
MNALTPVLRYLPRSKYHKPCSLSSLSLQDFSHFQAMTLARRELASKAFFCRPHGGICYTYSPILLFAMSGTSLAHALPWLHTRESEEISPRCLACGQEDFRSMHRLLRLTCAWMVVGLYAGGIFVLSSWSHPPSVSAWDLPHLDKLYHTLEYGGLTFVLIRALCLTCATRPSTSIALWAAVLVIVYGASDEFHQAFTPDRAMSLSDFLADATGAGVVASVWLWVQRRWLMLVKS